jgi:hypothetical protein
MLAAVGDVATLSFWHLLLLLSLLVCAMLIAGSIIIVSRAKVTVPQSPQHYGASVIRSWIAIALVMALIVFCATAFVVDDSSLRSTLFGGLIASVGAAVAFYFSSSTSDQARSDVLNAAVTMSKGGTAPTGFTAMVPPNTTANSPYSYRFAANGNPSPQYVLATGNLPDGLVLGHDGVLEGRATRAGSDATFSVRATNSAGSITTPDITIHVN